MSNSPWKCSNCDAVSSNQEKPCDCVTMVGYRGQQTCVFNKPTEQPVECADKEVERILALSDDEVMDEAIAELGSKEAVVEAVEHTRHIVNKAMLEAAIKRIEDKLYCKFDPRLVTPFANEWPEVHGLIRHAKAVLAYKAPKRESVSAETAKKALGVLEWIASHDFVPESSIESAKAFCLQAPLMAKAAYNALRNEIEDRGSE